MPVLRTRGFVEFVLLCFANQGLVIFRTSYRKCTSLPHNNYHRWITVDWRPKKLCLKSVRYYGIVHGHRERSRGLHNSLPLSLTGVLGKELERLLALVKYQALHPLSQCIQMNK